MSKFGVYVDNNFNDHQENMRQYRNNMNNNLKKVFLMTPEIFKKNYLSSICLLPLLSASLKQIVEFV